MLILLPNNPSPLFLELETETIAGRYNVHVTWSVHLLINIADPREWAKKLFRGKHECVHEIHEQRWRDVQLYVRSVYCLE